MRVAAYCRYSTHTQSDNYSIDIQIERITAACVAKGWELVSAPFIDAAYSGSNMERPALQEMLSRLNEFDVVMVYRLDRLSRSQRDTMTLIQDYFLQNNVAFVSVSETLDTTTPFGMAMIGILAVFAELERATITERMQGGIKKRVADGYWQVSGNNMPTGYKKVKNEDGKYVLAIDDYEAKKVQRIFDLYEQTHSINAIQKRLKSEGYERRKFTTIRRILGNRLYIGEVSYKDEHFPGVHEPLISIEQFERVQALLERHPKGVNAGKAKKSLFSTMITCGCCNEKYLAYSYKVKTKSKGDYYVQSYVCTAKRFPYQFSIKCTNRAIKNKELEKIFLIELGKVVKSRLDNDDSTVKRKANYNLAIKRIDEKITRLIDLYEDGEIDKDTLNARIQKRNKEKEEILLLKSSEEQREALQIDLKEIDKYITNFDTMDFESKRAFVKDILSSITIKPDEIIFEWNF